MRTRSWDDMMVVYGWCCLIAVATLAVVKPLKGEPYTWDWAFATIFFTVKGLLLIRHRSHEVHSREEDTASVPEDAAPPAQPEQHQ